MNFSCQRIIIALLLTLLTAVSGCTLPQKTQSELELTILHTNDVHANWGGYTKDWRTCYAPQCDGGKGGTLRLDRAVRALRASQPNVLLLDAGDEFQGTLYYTRFKESMAADVVNALQYDVFVPGNHEFDDGCERFASFVRALDVPVVAANFSLGAPYSDVAVTPWVITERQGHRIGIIGLVTPETPQIASPCAAAVFSPAEPAVRRAVEEMQKQDVSIVILVTHLGLANDRELARRVSGVDVIVGGHSHSVLSNTEKKADGTYPVVEMSPSGEPVLVVTAGYAGRLLGRLNIQFSKDGIAQRWNGNPLELTDAALEDLNAPPADNSLAQMMNERSEAVHSMLKESVGRINSDIKDGDLLESQDIMVCRTEECRTGNIVTNAMMQFWNGAADIALVSGGSLRASFPAGVVTGGDVIAVMPFENTLMLAQMDGKTLRAALEQGLSGYEDVRGYFLQTAGLRYAFNPKNERGKRLISAAVRDKNGQWTPLNLQKMYSVTTISYQARGGDGYTMFVPLQWKDSEKNLRDVIQDYFRSGKPVEGRLEGRITIH